MMTSKRMLELALLGAEAEKRRIEEEMTAYQAELAGPAPNPPGRNSTVPEIKTLTGSRRTWTLEARRKLSRSMKRSHRRRQRELA